MEIKKVVLDAANDVTLTCYLHQPNVEMPNAQTRPAVVVFPGGGYMAHSYREADPIAFAYFAQGYHAFVLRYSVGKENPFPRPLQDAQAALKTIHDNAEAWGVESGKIAVAGFSAGGHLAAMVGTKGTIRPNALILGYPCIVKDSCSIIPIELPSAHTEVDDKTPPTFIFATSQDELVPVTDSMAFGTSLAQAKIPYEMHIFAKGTHGLSLSRPFISGGFSDMVEPDVAEWFGLSLRWLINTFGDFDASKSLAASMAAPAEFDAYSVEVPIDVLWQNEACRNIITANIPTLGEGSDLETLLSYSVSLRHIANYSNGSITDEMLLATDEKLRDVPVGK